MIDIQHTPNTALLDRIAELKGNDDNHKLRMTWSNAIPFDPNID